ncbi:unnamed protein product, partial [marine sediment metagenome]
MKCPWGCGWEGEPKEYIAHLKRCKSFNQKFTVQSDNARRPTTKEMLDLWTLLRDEVAKYGGRMP